ncbi:MAG: hypothetical protein H6R24_1932 [Proteobacteria bacterium]|nr:hypothetical protein [Pseudomonadota bacterium]
MFQIAQPNAGGQNVHLPAGIVDVVLAVNLVADGFQQVGDGGAEGRTAAVADVQRAGGIGGDEFHLYPPAAAQFAPAKSVALVQNLVDHRLVGTGGEEEVDEAGSGDFHPGDTVGRGQGSHQLFGQFARFAASGFGQGEGQRAGEVAMRPIAGLFQRDGGRHIGGQQSILA